MMSVGLSEDDANDLLTSYAQASSAFGVSVACINSPCNVTLSGEEGLIDDLREILEGEKVFARKLHVPLAYHSQQMGFVSSKFESSLGTLAPSDAIGACVPMLSTVTGERTAASRLYEPSYWALNMVSPVRFDQAVRAMCAQSELALAKKIDMSHKHVSVVDHILEIGPHATLQVALREILRGFPRARSIECNSILRKGHSATKTMFETMGTLHCMGVPLNLREINDPAPAGQQRTPPTSMLVNLPEYPFDHSQRYWHESRLSRNYRLRSHAPSELLGARSRDWNASEARWRLFIRTAEVPWVRQHVVNGAALYPGTGMLVMAIEAAKQLVYDEEDHSIDSYTLRDVEILAPIHQDDNAEVQTSMHRTNVIGQSEIKFEFFIRTSIGNRDWLLNCHGFISVALSDNWDDWEGRKTEEQRQLIAAEHSVLVSRCSTRVDAEDMYRFLNEHGYDYGPVFQAARHQRCNEESREAAAEVTLFKSTEECHVIHPVSLDAILHLSLTALTSGGRRSMPTSIPSHVGYLWVSNEGLSRWDNDSITAFSAVTNVNRRSFTFKGASLEQQGTEKKLRLWVEDVRMTNVTPTPTTELLPNPEQFCMDIDCKPALNKLTPKEVDVLLREMHPVPRDESAFFRDLQLLVRISLRRLLASKPLESSQELWKTQYWRWAEHHTAQTGCLDNDTDQFFEDLCHRMRITNNVGRLYEAVASNLPALIHGTVNPLELLLQSSLLKDYYNMLANFRCAKQAASYMDLLAHQIPGLTILEIGGGTGSATRNMLGALRSNPDDNTLRCSRYDFTDVSPAFLDKAREEFAPYNSQMTFGTLNVELDFTEQGFQQGSYDIVVADNVLHITGNLAKTLKNVRRVLKPGGKAIIHELLDPSGWTAGFVFGLFPGWWLGTQDSRALSPNISAKDWDVVLKENGFSGADLVLRDFEDDVSHHLGHIVSTATTEEEAPSKSHRIFQAVIIVQSGCVEQLIVARDLVIALQSLVGCAARVLSIEEALSGDRYMNADELVIFLADYKASFLGSLDNCTWKFLKTLVQGSRHLLWVSGGGGRRPSPEYGMLDGLARTLRSEYYELHLVTLALDVDSSHNTRLVMQVVQDMIGTWSGNYEEEYIVIDGRLHTRRLVVAHHLKSAMDARLLPYDAISTSLADRWRFQMSTESHTGFDTTPYYRESISPTEEEEHRHNVVEILVKAVCLQSCESALAKNPEADSEFGSFCAGTVLLAGPATGFEPGDRVFAACKGCFRSHVRVVSSSVTKIPPDLSFVDACQTAPPRLLAYNALVEIGHVRYTDIVLVHDGASPIGQAALRLLLSDCVAKEVWVTADGQEDHARILKYLEIPEERILPMSWFDTRTMIASQWNHKFDVVFSSARESRVSSVLNLLRVGGRYIMLSATPESLGEIPCAPSNISSYIIHLGDVSTKPDALQYAVVLPPLSSLENTAQNTSRFFASDLTRVFNHLRNVSDRESIVVELDDATSIEVSSPSKSAALNYRYTKTASKYVQVRVKPRLKYSFDPQATYMIVGGLGGLGREMARWLASRGARYLILPSRSGPRSSEAQQLIAELRIMKVHVETPCCDMADRAALQAMLVGCSTMPPIKGCIQAAMVMTVRYLLRG
jgi:NADPH:quinone reductase-like Zn-dependent oxidoreductase/SAM-dependent methyltransferase